MPRSERSGPRQAYGTTRQRNVKLPVELPLARRLPSRRDARRKRNDPDGESTGVVWSPKRRSLLAAAAQLGRDVGERVVELAADGVHGTDDHNRDAGCDEAVLNGGRAALVTQETLER